MLWNILFPHIQVLYPPLSDPQLLFSPVPSRRRAAQTIRYHRLEAFDAWKIAACVA